MAQTLKRLSPGVVAMDLGTGGDGKGGLSVLWVTTEGEILASVTVPYKHTFVPDLPKGHNEQYPCDWVEAAGKAMPLLREKLRKDHNAEIGEVLCIGLAGQMHGEVIIDEEGESPWGARLWCDDRNADTAAILTELFGRKVPMRQTVARWLWTIENMPEKAGACTGITTPIGWLFYKLTGGWMLGIGEASGMFPVDPGTGTYDTALLAKFDSYVSEHSDTSVPSLVPPLGSLLPEVFRAGSFIAGLDEYGAELLGLPVGTPVAPPEGDQPAVLTGSFIHKEGSVAGSLGTSLCFNAVVDKPYPGIHPAIDFFLDPIGQMINMIWVKNGTTFLNAFIALFKEARGDKDTGDTFAALMPLAAAAAKDSEGLLALPFMEGEPGASFPEEGVAFVAGITEDNLKVGNLIHLAFLVSIFGLKRGIDELKAKGATLSEIVITGGVTKDEEYSAQLVADVINMPVRVLRSAEEGTAYGAALLALFAVQRENGSTITYADFLDQMLGDETGNLYLPDAGSVETYQASFENFLGLHDAEEVLLGAAVLH